MRWPGLKPLVQTVAGYIVAVALCLVILTLVLKLWLADLAIPFDYGGDTLLLQMWVKGMIEHGWYLHNDALGMPLGQDMADYPLVDSFHFLVMKLLSLGCGNAAVVLNLYFLLGFPLITLTALFVLRRLGASYWPALAASLLYTFLPYHLGRGECHLFLGAYYQVPLALLVVLWVYRGHPTLLLGRTAEGRLRWRLWSGASLGSLAICVLVASAGVYYAFFTCFFLAVAGLVGARARRAFSPVVVAGILIATIAGGVFVNLTPTLLYRRQHGENPLAVARAPVGAEIYGLKLAQLLLPVNGHRVTRLALLKAKYNQMSILNNENESAGLGLIGAVGFLFVLGRLGWRRAKGDVYDGLGLCTLAAVLLSTIGGLGSLAAYCGLESIRAYNRVSVFIAFCALAAVALTWERLRRQYASTPCRAMLCFSALILLLAAGIWDETSREVPPYGLVRQVWRNDEEFVARLEASVPAGSMVLQLPYRPFPECPDTHLLRDYDLLRPYLHSHQLRWSHAAMKGRAGDLWQRRLAELPLAEQVETAALAGFGGIYVDRAGFAEGGAQLEASLAQLLGAQPLESADQRFVFFAMTEYATRLHQRLPEAAWQARRE